MRPAAFARRVVVLIAIVLTAALPGPPALAQDISINFGQGGGVTERAIQLIALLTILSIAPSIVVMMTSFTRIVVVLSLLRTALGIVSDNARHARGARPGRAQSSFKSQRPVGPARSRSRTWPRSQSALSAPGGMVLLPGRPGQPATSA